VDLITSVQALGGYITLTIGSALDDVPEEHHYQFARMSRGGRSSEARILKTGETALGRELCSTSLISA
jgi:hypothetical protein